LTAVWPVDDNSENVSEYGPLKRVTSFTGRVCSDTESCDEELAYDYLAASYKDLYFRSAKICILLGEQKKINSHLLTERSNHLAKISELNNEISLLNSQLELIRKQAEMVTNDTTVLTEVTEDHGKRKENGIEFDYKPLSLRQRNRNVSYASEDHGMIKIEKYEKRGKITGSIETNVGSINKTMLKHSQGHQNGKKTTRPWICHYCKRKGHISPICYKLYGYPEFYEHKSHESEMRSVRKEWMPKGNNVGLMSHASQKPSSNKVWYFDSGCSKQMIGKISHIENIRPFEKGYVTFGDGGKGKIRGIGNSNGLPKLKTVFLVEGLFTNLISITQLCDQGMEANFDRFECKISNQEGEVLMRGIRTRNNCYKWIPEPVAQSDMFTAMLEHHESLTLPQLIDKDESKRVSENNSTLKNN